MAIVCNNIIDQLVVTMPATVAQFTENQSYPSACGSGTATDSGNASISGGIAPYSTTFSYTVVPATTNCTLNSAAFPGGSGISPQFGYGFSGSNMCALNISGTLRVNYSVSDASGQVVTGFRNYTVSINRFVTGGGSGGSGDGGGGDGGGDDQTEIQ